MPLNFLTSPDLRTQAATLRTEPGRSRLSLLLCALAVSLLSLLSTAAHTEPKVMVAIQRSLVAPIQRDQAMLRSTGADVVRQAKGAATGALCYVAQMGGW